jgi:xylulokinase
MSYLLGTDIGTTGTKTVMVDLNGKLKANSYFEYDVLNPRQGWAEQWPRIWLNAVYSTIKDCVEKSGIAPEEVYGIAISSLYGGSGIPVDRKFEVIRPCIIWADRRATKECKWVEEKIGTDSLFDVTGNVIDPYYGYTKMLWIRENEPDHWEKIHRLETPNAHVIRLLTGVENIDYSSAGNYGGIFDIHQKDWSSEMMEELGIPRKFFPEKIISSEEVVGEVTGEGSERTGLEKGTPICAGGIDAAVSALAGGAIEDGDLASMLGTSMCNGFISHKARLSQKLVNFPYVVQGREYLYGFTGISTAGYTVRWFRDQLEVPEKLRNEYPEKDSYMVLDELASEVEVGSDNLIFLPHMMVGERAPYWDEHLRGGFIGLTVSHTKAHLFRSVLEGVAYAMKYSIEVAKDTGIMINRATLVDGGARSPLWRQIIADVTGVKMDYIPGAQGAPLGDAILAGLGTGLLKDYRVIEEWLGEKVPMKPKNTMEYQKYYGLYVSCLEAIKPLFKQFSQYE